MSSIKRILITGGGGLLGQYLNLKFSENNDILTLYHENIGNAKNYKSVKIDLMEKDKLKEVAIEFKPDLILHTAAVSRPETAAAMDSKIVYEINVNVTKILGELANKLKANIIYFSTDLVYAGYRGSMLKEDAKLIPSSLYAETKLMGEVKIKEVTDNYIILRTSLLYGFGLFHSRNNFHNVYNSLISGKKVELFHDQFRTPLELFDATRIINEIIRKEVKGETFNFGGGERVSRYELGLKLCKIAGFDENLIIPKSLYDSNSISKVGDVSLDVNKLKSIGIEPMSIDQSIKRILSSHDFKI